MASASLKKRQVPLDFFVALSKRVSSSLVQTTAPSKSATPQDGVVPGLRILPDFITRDEEKAILDYLNSDQCSWRTDLSRRTMHFGGQYCLYTRPISGQPPPPPKPEILEAPPLPTQLQWLIDRFVEAGVYAEIDHKRPEYVIVNEYVNSCGISAHTENFSFHSPVVGLSLGSNDVMKFRELQGAFDGSVRSGKAGKAPRTGNVVDVTLPGRSLCVMSGLSRWNWQHEITPRKRGPGFKRVSLTFRVKKDEKIKKIGQSRC